MTWLRCALLFSPIIASPALAFGEDPASFDQQIAPLLARRCLGCHNASAKKGGLDLTSQAAAKAGGENGAAIEPGKPEESLLWKRIAADEMPPKSPLSAEEKKLLRAWLAGGAGWATESIDPSRYSSDQRAGYDWWSLQAVRKPAIPSVKTTAWLKNDIDAFVLAKLDAAQLSPAPLADARTLVRRLYFDLIGLPPSPEEMKEWSDKLGERIDDAAYVALVDHLLASPHYGERWGRHWLDVIRFGESQGYERNRIRDNAWRFRDWVIGAFNRDLPYDEFVRQQIAGDVLHPGELGPLLATGYHVIGAWDQVSFYEGSQEMKKAARQDDLEDLVATLGQAFLGLSLNCARCHDHKFDPLSQREYYQMAALLGGVAQEEKERQNIVMQSGTDASPQFAGVAHVIVPRQPPIFHVLARGDYRQEREVVRPAGLIATSHAGLSPDFNLAPDAPEAERRKALAAWLTDPRNPLPARVIVNRVWHYHFGHGIVDTPSDFGFAGGRPSHPELLDYLTSRFIDGGWRLKELHRLIVNSATYRQASNVANEKAATIDADNRLLWRANARRLEGELVRDAVLAVSGSLNRQLGGPSYRDMKVDGGKMGTNSEFTDPTGEFTQAVNRRTVYRLWARQGSNPLLDSLDCPDPAVMTPRRTETITPLQALSLLNNRVIEQAATKLAERARKDAGEDVQQRIGLMYDIVLGRPPRPDELELVRGLVDRHGLEQLALVLLNANEFLWVE
jgi:hypothetical protein